MRSLGMGPLKLVFGKLNLDDLFDQLQLVLQTKIAGIPAPWLALLLIGALCILFVNIDAAVQRRKKEGLVQQRAQQNDARREAMREAFKNSPAPAQKSVLRNRKAPSSAREERKYLGGGGHPRMSSGEVALLAMKEQESKSARPLWAAAGPGTDSSSNSALKAKEEKAERTLLSESERALSEADARAARALQATFDRELVKDQDQGYEESLRADQDKKREKLKEQDALEEEEQLLAQQAIAESLALERDQAMLELRDEPAAGADGVVELAFRLPTGGRLSRRFLSSDTMDFVFMFLRCSQEVRAT
jgi:hypothetical protein